MEKKAHSEGATTINFHQKSEQILTSGADGNVKVWDALDDEDPLKTFKIGGNLHSLALKDQLFYTVNEKGNGLVPYNIDDGLCQGLLTRFTASITCITSNSTHIAAGASDFMIRVVNSEGDVCTLSGHEAPILSLSLAPKSGHLLSASCDGTVRLWTIKTRCCLQTYNLLPKVSDASLSSSTCGVSWHCDGLEFAVPLDNEVRIYSKDSDQPTHTFSDEALTKPVNVCCHRKDGALLAAATTDGFIIVWSCTSRAKVLSIHTDSKATITCLSWYKESTVLYANNQGCFGSISVPVASSSEEKKGAGGKLTNEEIADMFDGSDDENFMDTEAAEDPTDEDFKDLVEEHEDEVKQNRKLPKSNTIEDDDDDFGSEMTGSIAPSAPEKESCKPAVPAARADVTKPPETPLLSELVTDEQEPFQPGSTPTNHKSRYMVWNSVGAIRSYTTEDESTIDIEFHDTSRHHTIHLNNTDGYSMADLSDECAVLATEDSGKGRSSLLCIHYGGGDDKQQWSTTLSKQECVECICVGGDFVAMATSSHMVRAFTTAGFQLAPFLIPGAPVAMAAYKNVLMVVYHTAPALNGYQHLSVSILTVTGTREVLTHCSKLPLSGSSTLTWLGFSCEGTPLMYDSNGILSMYRIDGHDLWTPVIDTKAKDKHSSHFIVSVAEVPPQIRCVVCKANTYPSTSSRPALGILDYHIPLCGLDTDTGMQEESVWRARLLTQATNNWLSGRAADTTSYDKQEQTSLLKLFSAACREGRLDRAYQIANLMSEAYTKLAAQYANRTHNVDLAQKLSQLARQKALRDEQEEEEESVFGLVHQPLSGFLGYSRVVSDEREEDPADDLTRFTAARFSTTPSKEIAASIITSQSQHSVPSHTGQQSPIETDRSAPPGRTSFANVLSQEDTQQSQDSQSFRPNPFKRKSNTAVKRTSIDDMHRMLDDKEQQKQELKKSSSLPLQPPKVKQTKLFPKSSAIGNSAKLKSKESIESSPVANENAPTEEKPEVSKISAFDLYYKENFEGKSRSDAMDAFRILSKETKKEYSEKVSAINGNTATTAVIDTASADKKRKHDSLSEPEAAAAAGSAKKQVLVTSENTKSKLAAYSNS